MMTEESRPLEGQLHDLSVVVSILTRAMDAYFEGDTDAEEWRSWDAKAKSVRRVLVERANSTLDLYEARADGRGCSPRASMLLGMIEVDLKRFDVEITEDGRLFTYSTKGATGDGKENGTDAGQ